MQRNNRDFLVMIKERTCVICRTKMDKDMLFRFGVLDNEIVIDVNHRLRSYGYYICKDEKKCFPYLTNWLKRRKKIKRLDVLNV